MRRLLTQLVTYAAAAPVVTLAVLAVLTVAAGVFAAAQFRVNADQASLIAPDAPFQQRFEAFREAFPAYRRTTLAVVEAPSASLAADGARRLATALAARDDLFTSVFTPAAFAFYRENGLLYLPDSELDARLDRMVRAQPALATVANARGLEGLLTLLRQGAAADGGTPDPALDALAADLADAARRAAEDPGAPLAPLALAAAGSGDTEPPLQIVTIQMREDATDFLSPRAKLDVIRTAAADLGLTEANGYRVRLTGNIPLSTDELAQVRDSLGLAGAISLVFLALVLGVGVRSARIVSVMILTLAVGGVWSMAWAMAAVGELNLLSASFAVLFVGLGIDFAIHFALRVQEDVEAGQRIGSALAAAAGEVGPAIALGAVTSAIGFLSFLPTDYKGFADLGIIAGGGMILAFLAALTVIPACLALAGLPAHRQAGEGFTRAMGRAFAGVRRHARAIAGGAAAVFVGAAALATQATFDFSTLSLKNAQSESITTLADLQARGLVTDYAAYVVTPSLEEAEAAADTLRGLPTVEEARTALSLLPENQDGKLARIEETAFLMFAPLAQAGAPAAPVPEDLSLPPASEAYRDLAAALEAAPDAALARLNGHLAGEIGRELQALGDALSARPVTGLDAVPAPVRDRFLAEDGRALAIGLPDGDITETPRLRAFVAQVKEAFPDSTGRAVVEATVGDIVVGAFITALLIAVAAVTAVVLIATRSVADTALVLFPLALAAAATAATGVLIGLPFNQANIIVLPLIMGLGVDNGLHVLMRYREDGSLDRLLASSTPRAVVLSTLTTIGAFGALGVSTHAGTASMGILLTIAMAYLLVATVLILPALIALRDRPAG